MGRKVIATPMFDSFIAKLLDALAKKDTEEGRAYLTALGSPLQANLFRKTGSYTEAEARPLKQFEEGPYIGLSMDEGNPFGFQIGFGTDLKNDMVNGVMGLRWDGKKGDIDVAADVIVTYLRDGKLPEMMYS